MRFLNSIHKTILFSTLAFLVFTSTFSQQEKFIWQENTSNGYTYKYVTNDPMQVRFYTLKNGLKVMLSVNKREPRIAVNFAIRAGSNSDPKTHTGLAHYLEHILFKGTNLYGSLDWEKEKPLLDEIESLYEVYNQTSNTEIRESIYKQIDSVSNVASKYAISNEYTKLMSEIGSEGTNAHTWVEETVYKENIPSNEIDRFLVIEADRFRNPVVRLFHTELEAVYEEKNRTLDNDGRKMYEVTNQALFPTHNYGQQSTIGTIDHLKNPSIKAIKEYYNTYYVPNNMAIIMVGDFDPDVMIAKVDQHFSYMQPKAFETYNPSPEMPILEPIVREVYGPTAENIRISWRTPAAYAEDVDVLNLITQIISNGKAGLFDININQKQVLQGASNSFLQFKDYGIFSINGYPKQEQSLDEVKNILMAEIEKLKNGDFDDALLKAIIANFKLYEQQSIKFNGSRLQSLLNMYIKTDAKAWDKEVAYLDMLSNITKEDVVRVANTYFKDNYLVLYKRKGEDKGIVKVDKPAITPIETNTGKESDYVREMKNFNVNPIAPQWIDFNTSFVKSNLKNVDVYYIQNNENQLFSMEYRFDMGERNNRYLPLAFNYLDFLSTNQYTPEALNKKLYGLASNYNVNVYDEVTTIKFNGLQENFKETLGLFEHLLANCNSNEEALTELKGRIFKYREDSKSNKQRIVSGMVSYAVYGENNPFNDVLSNEEINAISSNQLIEILHSFFNYKHSLIYYGPLSENEFKDQLSSIHDIKQDFIAYPDVKTYTYEIQNENKVLFTDYDMVQSEISWVRNVETYNPKEEPYINVFNEYFGGGMGSLVFKIIRESKALAYSTYAVYSIPDKSEKMFAMRAYVGSQSDKMLSAIEGMNELLNDLPLDEQAFELAKEAIRKSIQTQRINENEPIYMYFGAKKKGVDYDLRKTIYETIDTITFDDIKQLHGEKIANKPYTYCIIGSEDKISDTDLQKIGQLKKLTLEQIFGY